MSKTKIHNQLLPIRRKLGLSRKQVAAMLGYAGISTVARHEQGRLIPPLQTLLQMEILYCMPVAYLYADYYAELRDGIRQRQIELKIQAGGATAKEVSYA